jgi:transglutaminase-like putative cysteine protease
MHRLRIVHFTEYQYVSVVTLRPHRLLVRPREGHDVHIESSRLSIFPAHSVKWQRDVFDNSVAIARFTESTDRLTIESEVVLDHYENTPLDFLVEDYALKYPFHYQLDERADLLPYQQPTYPSSTKQVGEWLTSFRFGAGASETYVMLDTMNRAIAAGFAHYAREAEGVQTPSETLTARSGACRDHAALFIDACRQLGLAARFVSGYIHGPVTEAGNAATHAWAEVYLPGAGWKGFDPTLGEVTGGHHIPVAVARHPEAVPPVSGTFVGTLQRPSLTVNVQVLAL